MFCSNKKKTTNKYVYMNEVFGFDDIIRESEEKGCCRVRIIEDHDYKTLMGPCLFIFSILLFIPGVVLMVVGSYGNEHTFPYFGGWHITGIVISTIAVSLSENITFWITSDCSIYFLYSTSELQTPNIYDQ